MKLAEAKKIKSQLIEFEGQKDNPGFPGIWKIMISPEGTHSLVMKGCINIFNFDDSFSELNLHQKYEVYIIGQTTNGHYTHEQFESFIIRHNLQILTEEYDCAFCTRN